MNTQMTQNTMPGDAPVKIDVKIIIRFALVAVALPLILFVAAGRVDWWQGWMYTVVTILLSVISRYILFRVNPALINERSRFTQSEGIKEWDKRLVVWIAITGPLAFMIVAGLDKRYGWSPDVSLPLTIVGLVGLLLGYALATWAMTVNRFFSSVVRIQTDRGQTVITSGPYRYVRHPGYSGGIVGWITSPLLLGSLWSFIPVGLVIALYVLRTAREDRTLQAELPGYSDYARHTRYRLIPGIW